MSTLLGLRTIVRAEVSEENAGRWTDTVVNEYINAAARRFSVDTGILMAPPRKATVTADYAIYTLPDDCPGPQAVISLSYDGSELTPTAPAALFRAGDKPQEDSGTPTHWYGLTDGGAPAVGLFPIPESTLADGLVIWYWKLAAAMTADGDVCDIPDEYERGIVFAASEFCFMQKRDNEQAAIRRMMYKAEVTRAREYVTMMKTASLHHQDASDIPVRTIF